MRDANPRGPRYSARLVGVAAWLPPTVALAVLARLFGWGPVAAPWPWLLLLGSGALLAGLDARVALGWRRSLRTGLSLWIVGWLVVRACGWAGAPLVLTGGPPPAAIAAAMALAWVVVLTAAAGVALRSGLGPRRTAVLTALGVMFWAVPAGEAFTAISALTPAALAPAWAGWSRPTGAVVLVASIPLALLGWWRTRPHHPALAATRHPDLLYAVHGVVTAAAAWRHGRPLVAGIGTVGMFAFLFLPGLIRRQRGAALIRRATRHV